MLCYLIVFRIPEYNFILLSSYTPLQTLAKSCNSTQRGAIALIIGEFNYVGLREQTLHNHTRE